MSALKIMAVGDSAGVVLPEDVLTRLKLDRSDNLILVGTPDGGCRISPPDPVFEEQMTAARGVMKERSAVLRELAK
jgi:putative addiction module antidote